MPRKSKNVMKSTLTRGLKATPSQIAAFPFDHTDMTIVQAMMQGAITPKQVSDETGIKFTLIKQRLLDPARCGWMSSQLREAVGTRLGNVIASVYSRAVSTGDPRSAKLLLDLYKEMDGPIKKHLHVHTNLNGLTDLQLEKMIKQKKQALNMMDAEYKVTHGDLKDE